MARLALLLVLLLPASAQAQYFAFGQNRVRYEAPVWQRVQTSHVDVYFYEAPGAPVGAASAVGGERLGAFAAEAAEEAYAQIAALFGADVTARIPLVVYPTAAAFAVTNVADLPIGADGIGGVTEGFKNRIAVPFTGDWRQLRRVVHHEMVHAVMNALVYGGSVQSLLRSGLRTRIPLWFGEGLAEYSALGWETATDSYVRDALVDGELPPLERLGGYDAYRGGQAFWDFVATEYGREKITEILERLRYGRSVPEALRRSTGLGLADLSDRWQAALRPAQFPETAARDAIADVARPVLTARRAGTLYNGRPALSPLGDRVAAVSTRDGTFDIVIAETAGDAPPRVLVAGEQAAGFEAFRVQTAGLAWSPDGRTLAVAVTSGPSDAVAFVDVPTGRTRLVRPEGLDAVLALAWSPDGTALAVEATAGAQPDLFLLNPATGTTRNLTRDVYADHAPAWAPDGRALVFHSDRGADTSLGGGTADVRALGRASMDLYRLELPAASGPGEPGPEPGAGEGPLEAPTPTHVTRLTDDARWDDTDAALARTPDGRERLVFLSDRNGVANLYEWRPDGPPLPLTDLLTGALGLSLAADGSRAAVLALDHGAPSVYLLRDPLGGDSGRWKEEGGNARLEAEHSETERSETEHLGDADEQDPDSEAPSVDERPLSPPGGEGRGEGAPAHRADADSTEASPTDASHLEAPIGPPPTAHGPPVHRSTGPPLAPTVWALRKAGADAFPDTAPAVVVASARLRTENPFLRDALDGTLPEAPSERPQLSPEMLARADSLVAALFARADSLRAAGVSPRPDSLTFALGPPPTPDLFRPRGARDARGRLVARPYRLRFTPDLVTAAGSYDTVYGVQSITQIRFSDVLGDWRLALATNLVLDLRNADYVLSLRRLRGRREVSLEGFHLARELPDFRTSTVFRYRNYGLVGAVRYPLSRTRRLDAEVGLIGVSLSDLSQITEPTRSRAFVVPRVTATADRTGFGRFGPRRGGRAAASLAVAVGPDAFFATVLADGRRYWSTAARDGAVLALRGSAGISAGPDPQRFYAAGVQTWLNPRLGSLPVQGPDDFVFATPVLPLRGFGFNEAAGDRFALVNLEARVPLLSALAPGGLPLPSLTRLQATAFVDAGVIAQGGLDVWRTPTDSAGAELPRVLDDVLIGAGAGLRTVVLGYPFRLDWAAPFDGRRFGDVRTYVSLGLDF